MKKFISVLLAILMVVAVMPFAIFADDAAVEESPLHPCHPDSFTDIDLNAAIATVTAKTAADVHAGVLTQYLTDGNNATATRLPTGDKVTFSYKFGVEQGFAKVSVVVNGKGTINPGDATEGRVIADSNHDFKVKVVIKNAVGTAVYTSEEVSTKDQTTLVFDVFTPGTTLEVIVDAAKATTGGPRIWEIDANKVKPEEEYVHTMEQVVITPSTTKTAGKAYDKCANCDYEEEEYDLPLLTAADLTGGILTLDDVTIEEYIKEVDGQGNVLKDDDGNDILIDKPYQADPEALFDGNTNSGGLWSASGSYWTAAPGGKVTIKFNEPKEIAFIKFHLTFNGWPGVSFQFYNGETLVAKKNGNWKAEGEGAGTTDDRWTNTWQGVWVDFAAEDYCDLQGKVIDKIVIEVFHHGTHNYRKISEIQIGCHQHVYDPADVKANGTQGTGKDICKWTHNATCLECEAKATNAVTYLHDIKTDVIREVECGNSIYTDTCKAEGCEYKNENYSVPGTGEHDFSTYVTQTKFANCGTDGVSNFVCTKCKERQEITGFEVLVGKKLAADLVVGPYVIAKSGTVITMDILSAYMEVVEIADKIEVLLACTDAQTDAAVTVKFSATADFMSETVSYKVGAVANGYHTMGYKNAIPSTYTVQGLDIGYCTTCGATYQEISRAAAYKSLDSVVRVRFNGFTLRTSEFEGIRATFTVNREAEKVLKDAGYSTRIWVVATNEAGETSEIQIYGAGAKNWIDINGKVAVVVKDVADADEVITFQLKISVKDDGGEQVIYRDVDATTLAAVKAAGK